MVNSEQSSTSDEQQRSMNNESYNCIFPGNAPHPTSPVAHARVVSGCHASVVCEHLSRLRH
eukprot:9115943-Lingulodinium_polyedra.AAC.1